MWLSEIEHDNFVWINKSSAEKLNIRDREKVKLVSKINSLEATVRLTQGIHPTTIAMNRNLGHTENGRVSKGQKFDSEDANTSIIWWSSEKPQPHPNRLLEIKNDAAGEGQIWNNCVVKIYKI